MLKKIIIFIFLKHLNSASTGLITQVHYIDSKVKYFRKQKKPQNNNNKEKKTTKTKQNKKNGQVKVNLFWKQQLTSITQEVHFMILSIKF